MVQIEVSLRTIALLLSSVLAVWLVYRLWAIVLTVAVALILVGTLSPLITRLVRRGLRRGPAVLLVFLGLLAIVVVVLLVSLPPLLGELLGLLADAPAARDRLIVWLGQRPLTTPLAQLVRDVGSEQVLSTVGTAVLTASSKLLIALGYATTAVALACYILAAGPRSQAGLYAIVPRSHHVRLARIMIELEVIVGGYVRGQLITSGAITAFTFVLLTLCGVPNALSLAVFAGLADVIPYVGGCLAVVPAALGGLAVSPTVAIVIAVTMFVYSEFEARYLVPLVYGRALRLSAAAVILALIVGGTLLGILGAMLALPLTAALLMILRELRVELPGDDSEDVALRARDSAAEATYARISAGAAPEQAVVLATELAREYRAAEPPVPALAADTRALDTHLGAPP